MIKPAPNGAKPMRGRIDPFNAGKSGFWGSAISFSAGVSLPVVRKRGNDTTIRAAPSTGVGEKKSRRVKRTETARHAKRHESMPQRRQKPISARHPHPMSPHVCGHECGHPLHSALILPNLHTSQGVICGSVSSLSMADSLPHRAAIPQASAPARPSPYVTPPAPVAAWKEKIWRLGQG